jgi:hypothetical protein
MVYKDDYYNSDENDLDEDIQFENNIFENIQDKNYEFFINFKEFIIDNNIVILDKLNCSNFMKFIENY